MTGQDGRAHPPLLPAGRHPQNPVTPVALPCPLPRWLTKQTLGGERTHYPSNYCPRPSHVEIMLLTVPGKKRTYFCSEQKVGGNLSSRVSSPVPDELRVHAPRGPSGFSTCAPASARQLGALPWEQLFLLSLGRCIPLPLPLPFPLPKWAQVSQTTEHSGRAKHSIWGGAGL